jgi:hypothetical protein
MSLSLVKVGRLFLSTLKERLAPHWHKNYVVPYFFALLPPDLKQVAY